MTKIIDESMWEQFFRIIPPFLFDDPQFVPGIFDGETHWTPVHKKQNIVSHKSEELNPEGKDIGREKLNEELEFSKEKTFKESGYSVSENIAEHEIKIAKSDAGSEAELRSENENETGKSDESSDCSITERSAENTIETEESSEGSGCSITEKSDKNIAETNGASEDLNFAIVERSDENGTETDEANESSGNIEEMEEQLEIESENITIEENSPMEELQESQVKVKEYEEKYSESENLSAMDQLNCEAEFNSSETYSSDSDTMEEEKSSMILRIKIPSKRTKRLSTLQALKLESPMGSEEKALECDVVEEKMKVVEEFSALVKLIPKHMNQAMEESCCAMCNYAPKTRWNSQTVESHALGHLPDPAFKCKLCQTFVRNIRSHMYQNHNELREKFSDQDLKIRTEVAEEALATLSLCYPGSEHLREVVKENEAFLDENSPVLTGEEREKAEALGLNYHEYLKKMAKDMRQRIPDETVNCSKCEFTFHYGKQWSWRSLETHCLTHIQTLPFLCKLCSKLCRDIRFHVQQFHSSDKKGFTPEDFQIRAEVTAEALENLFRCFPKFVREEITHDFEEHELADDELVKALEFQSQFLVIGKLMTLELKNSVKDKENYIIRCEKCSYFELNEQTNWNFRKLESHVLKHLGRAPFKCKLCYEFTSNLRSHVYCKHTEEKAQFNAEDFTKIRPEVAEEANQLWFHCFPGFDHVLKLAAENDAEATEKRNQNRENARTGKMRFVEQEGEEETEEGKRSVDLFPLYCKVLTVELRKSVESQITYSIPCTKCEFALTDAVIWNGTTLKNHTLTHLQTAPFKCRLCSKPLSNLRQHVSNVHYEEKDTFAAEELSKLRPCAALEAVQCVFDCFPGFQHVKQIPHEELKEMCSRKKKIKESSPTQRPVEETALTAEEMIKAKDLVLKFPAYAKQITGEMRKSVENQRSVNCAQCSAFAIDTEKLLGYRKIQAHALTHVDMSAFNCKLCGRHVRNLRSHVNSRHTEEKQVFSTEEYSKIRPEAASEAIAALFQCFPEHVKQLEPQTHQEVELSEDEQREAEELAMSFPVFTKLLTEELGKGDEVACSMCGYSVGKMRLCFRRIEAHVLKHLQAVPFHCKICDKSVRNLRFHVKKQHENDKALFSSEECTRVRPQVAKAAITTLFNCFPGYEHIRNAEILHPETSQEMDSAEESEMEESEEVSEESARKFQLFAKLLTAELKKSVRGQEEYKIACSKCNFVMTSAQKWNFRILESHVLSHAKIAPFKCKICSETIRDYRGHVRRRHETSQFETKDWTTLRPEAASPAISLLFECFPGFEYVRDFCQISLDTSQESQFKECPQANNELVPLKSPEKSLKLEQEPPPIQEPNPTKEEPNKNGEIKGGKNPQLEEMPALRLENTGTMMPPPKVSDNFHFERKWNPAEENINISEEELKNLNESEKTQATFNPPTIESMMKSYGVAEYNDSGQSVPRIPSSLLNNPAGKTFSNPPKTHKIAIVTPAVRRPTQPNYHNQPPPQPYIGYSAAQRVPGNDLRYRAPAEQFYPFTTAPAKKRPRILRENLEAYAQEQEFPSMFHQGPYNHQASFNPQFQNQYSRLSGFNVRNLCNQPQDFNRERVVFNQGKNQARIYPTIQQTQRPQYPPSESLQASRPQIPVSPTNQLRKFIIVNRRSGQVVINGQAHRISQLPFQQHPVQKLVPAQPLPQFQPPENKLEEQQSLDSLEISSNFEEVTGMED